MDLSKLAPLALCAGVLVVLSKVTRTNPEFFTDSHGGVHPVRGSEDYSITKAHETTGSRKVFLSKSRSAETLSKIEDKIKSLNEKRYALDRESRTLEHDSYYAGDLTPAKRRGLRKRAQNLSFKADDYRQSVKRLEKTAIQLERRKKVRA